LRRGDVEGAGGGARGEAVDVEDGAAGGGEEAEREPWIHPGG
jgi:hypothetical protein